MALWLIAWLIHLLGGSRACQRRFGSSPACLLARRLSGLSTALWLVGLLLARRLFGLSAALWLVWWLFDLLLAAPWWQKGWWHAVSLHVFPNSLSFCRCCIVQIMSYALYFCFLGLLTLGAVPDVCTNNLRPVPFSFLSSFELGLLQY